MEDEIIRSILDECMLNKIYEGKSAKYWLKYEFHEIYIILYDDTPLINNDYHHIMFMRKTKTGNKIYEVDELFKKFYNILPIVLKEMLGVHAYCMSYEYLVLDDSWYDVFKRRFVKKPILEAAFIPKKYDSDIEEALSVVALGEDLYISWELRPALFEFTRSIFLDLQQADIEDIHFESAFLCLLDYFKVEDFSDRDAKVENDLLSEVFKDSYLKSRVLLYLQNRGLDEKTLHNKYKEMYRKVYYPSQVEREDYYIKTLSNMFRVPDMKNNVFRTTCVESTSYLKENPSKSLWSRLFGRKEGVKQLTEAETISLLVTNKPIKRLPKVVLNDIIEMDSVKLETYTEEKLKVFQEFVEYNTYYKYRYDRKLHPDRDILNIDNNYSIGDMLLHPDFSYTLYYGETTEHGALRSIEFQENGLLTLMRRYVSLIGVVKKEHVDIEDFKSNFPNLHCFYLKFHKLFRERCQWELEHGYACEESVQ